MYGGKLPVDGTMASVKITFREGFSWEKKRERELLKSVWATACLCNSSSVISKALGLTWLACHMSTTQVFQLLPYSHLGTAFRAVFMLWQTLVQHNYGKNSERHQPCIPLTLFQYSLVDPALDWDSGELGSPPGLLDAGCKLLPSSCFVSQSVRWRQWQWTLL